MTSTSWIQQLATITAAGESAVLVTVAEHKGSTPREAGAKMIVTTEQCYDTIGGGHLEHKAIKHARLLLANRAQRSQIEHFALGASLGQCCGGAITLLFEPINPPALTVAIFGAGHIAKALVPIIGHLPCQVRWIDSREHEFPSIIPSNTQPIISEQLTDDVQDLPPNSYVLVMTHSHQLDQAIVETVLARKDALHLGMIGSDTKRRKCEHRLRHKGFTEQEIMQLTCPIGLTSISGKLPGEIAVSVAAHLIQTYQQQVATACKQGTQNTSSHAEIHHLG